MKSLVIFASGAGSNAQAIIDYFKGNGLAKVSLIVCNKPNAGVLNIAHQEGIPTLLIDKVSFQDTATVQQLLHLQPDLVVLAGFLWKIPAAMVAAFPNKIINIHPALLPKYGGKGMYGHHVHQAVVDNKEKESGITIHYVNEHYDEGNIILQATTKVDTNDTANDVAGKIHKLEHFYFPRCIQQLLYGK